MSFFFLAPVHYNMHSNQKSQAAKRQQGLKFVECASRQLFRKSAAFSNFQVGETGTGYDGNEM